MERLERRCAAGWRQSARKGNEWRKFRSFFSGGYRKRIRGMTIGDRHQYHLDTGYLSTRVTGQMINNSEANSFVFPE